MKKIIVNSKAVFIAVCFLVVTTASGQGISNTHIGGGEWSFQSDFPQQYLHFYLFGDGHHSFEKNNTHFYDNNALGATPIVYYAKPYGPVDPDEDELTVINQGTNQPIIDSYDMSNKVMLKRSWNMVGQNDNYMILMFENIESQNPISGCVEFHFSSSDININSNDILDDYGNDWVEGQTLTGSDYPNLGYQLKYKWTFDDLKYQEQRLVYIPVWCMQAASAQIKTMAVMKVANCYETIPYDAKDDAGYEEGNNFSFYTLNSVVANSPHDPNCIVSETRCLNEADVNQTVEYRVYFQNEGVDAAADVTVNIRSNKVPFGDLLYSYDVTLLAASHNCVLTLDPNGTSKVFFENIHLLGTNSTPPPPDYNNTIGWVDLEFCYDLTDMTTLQLDELELNVDIFFDSQAPITANNTLPRGNSNCGINDLGNNCSELINGYQVYTVNSLRIEQPHQFNEVEGLVDFEIAPNPALNYLNLNLISGSADDDYEIRILDVQNNLIRNLKYDVYSNQKLDISDLPPSVYFVMLKGTDSFKVRKFVKF